MIRLASIIVILAAILPYVNAVPDEDPPTVGDPTVTVSIDQDVEEVDVQPGERGETSFTGIVTVEVVWQPGIQYLIVSLHYTLVGGTAVGPSQLRFDKVTNQLPFDCDVKMPEMTNAGDYILTVNGQWRYSPGAQQGPVTPDESIVRVKPYSKPSIGADKSYKIANVGEECSFELSLINEGNCADNVTLTYDLPDGVEVSAPSTIQVDARSEKAFIVKLVQKGGSSRTNVVTIHASGSHEGKEASKGYEIQLKTRLSPSSFTGPLLIFPVALMGMAGAGIYAIFRIRRKKKVR